jgi:hypothetical protein
MLSEVVKLIVGLAWPGALIIALWTFRAPVRR